MRIAELAGRAARHVRADFADQLPFAIDQNHVRFAVVDDPEPAVPRPLDVKRPGQAPVALDLIDHLHRLKVVVEHRDMIGVDIRDIECPGGIDVHAERLSQDRFRAGDSRRCREEQRSQDAGNSSHSC